MNDITMGEGGVGANDNLNLFKGLSNDPVEAVVQREKASAETPIKSTPYPWILSPKIDLLFCCGGLFWVLYLCLYLTNYKLDLTSNSPAFWLAAASIIGMHIFGDGHATCDLLSCLLQQRHQSKTRFACFLCFSGSSFSWSGYVLRTERCHHRS